MYVCVSVGVGCVVSVCVCLYVGCWFSVYSVLYVGLCKKRNHFQVLSNTIMQHCTPWHLSMLKLATLQNHTMYVYAVYMYA